ncbi:MAG: tRNA modification GTPase, partial [Planctomycetaceae bacterium]|nr:tRNA modification GTPase [Planctomycetaceae bacterium]
DRFDYNRFRVQNANEDLRASENVHVWKGRLPHLIQVPDFKRIRIQAMYSATELDLNSTIVAIASAPGRGERGILRLSGPDVLAVLKSFLQTAQPPTEIDPQLPQCYSCEIPFGELAAPLPIALLVWPTKQSYTGQPSAEIHTVGSQPVLEALLNELCQGEVRPAGPGEFTLRAVLAGKMTLLQAEAVIGVIDAKSQQELERALTQLAGGISRQMRTMRDQLLSDLADLEAGLDFVDEDIDFVERGAFLQRLLGMREAMHELAQQARRRMIHRSAFHVVLAGLPNAGKSTLFNLLTGKQAIVSDQRGTTTDYVSAMMEDQGLSIQLIDTAGWEVDQSGISALAQQSRHEQTEQADLVLWCEECQPDPEEALRNEQYRELLERTGISCLCVQTKSDRLATPSDLPENVFPVSARSREGLERLKSEIGRLAREARAGRQELLASSAARCRDSLDRAAQHLQAACDLAAQGSGDELIAEELRGTLRELGLILGQVHTDDLLDIVFSRFCIGK